MNRVLILEPAKSVRKSLCELMGINGFEVLEVENLAHYEDALRASAVRNAAFDLLICNVDCKPSVEVLCQLPFIVLSEHSSIDEAFEMAHLGAQDYLSTPYDMNRLLRDVREVMKRGGGDCEQVASQRAKRGRRRHSKQAERERSMVGTSPEITHLRELIDKIAPSDARVMILGENGTGKELVARCIHDKSRRRDAPFVEVNCAAIPSELIESELFGHEKGAFTSAVKLRHGKFEQASGGTLFLDEIGDMSLAAQAKVLRALQERKITRVGSDSDIDVDVRVLAATNKDIRLEIAEGRFREDLYHRLSVIVINVAPLRERIEDIPILIEHFLREVCSEYQIECKSIDRDAVELLCGQRWSGNIRELRNIVERLVVLCDERITAKDIKLYCFDTLAERVN